MAYRPGHRSADSTLEEAGPMGREILLRAKMNRDALMYEKDVSLKLNKLDEVTAGVVQETKDKQQSWSLLAAWGGDENACMSQGENKAIPPCQHPRLTSLAGDSDDDASVASKSTYAVTRSDCTGKVSSPGAYLRLQSIATAPAPHPLPDLLRLTASRHQIPMDTIIHSMASLSRAGKERGKKKTNQDSCFAFRQFVHAHQAIAGVMDGHGPNGHAVSRFIRKKLPAAIAEEIKAKGEVAVQPVLRSSFIQAHEDLRYAPESINARLSGSTALVTLLQGKRITAAWVGDSRAIVVRQEEGGVWRGIPLTQDHKPSVTGEYNRIVNCGGRVEKLADSSGREIGPYRVWLPRAWVPGLAMSRAIGDFVAHSVGVIADPEVVIHEVDDRDTFLILASDGVWEFMSIQDVATLVAPCVSAEEACRLIVQEATSRWQAVDEGVTDDITVVATKFLKQ